MVILSLIVNRKVVTHIIILFLVSCSSMFEPTPMKPYPSSSSTPASDWWHPAPGLSWQWQLGDEVDPSYQVDVYDIDLYADQSIIDSLHKRGIKVICYISVGSWENWRPDADQFPEEVLGRDYEGWKGEKWLDIRRLDLLTPIMRQRFDLCSEKGFDAIEPDNMEIYTNRTRFPLTYQDQLTYAIWLASEAHSRGLAIGQKNAPDMTADLVNLYDFAITEDAHYYGWADELIPYIKAGKPVFAAEYTDMDVDFKAACRWGSSEKFSFILKNRDLDAWFQSCD